MKFKDFFKPETFLLSSLPFLDPLKVYTYHLETRVSIGYEVERRFLFYLFLKE